MSDDDSRPDGCNCGCNLGAMLVLVAFFGAVAWRVFQWTLGAKL